MHCLRLFIVVLHLFTVIVVVCSLKSMCIPSFVLIGCCVNELHAPIVMYYPRLFIVVLQDLQCLQCCLHVDIIRVIGIFNFTKFRLSIPSGF